VGMLLKGYRIEMFRPECNPGFRSLNCHAHLDQDIGPLIPYLNAVLGGTAFVKEPPSVMFRVHGRLIAVHADKISINSLADAVEAAKVMAWLQREINETWENRERIIPKYEVAARPQPMEVLKLLPKTNCGECGQPTCLVFSTLVAKGAKGAGDCLGLDNEGSRKLEEYLSGFEFIDY